MLPYGHMVVSINVDGGNDNSTRVIEFSTDEFLAFVVNFRIQTNGLQSVFGRSAGTSW